MIASWGPALAPVAALAAGGMGAGVGASLDGRLLRRLPRAGWVRAGLAAAGAGGAAALGAAVFVRLAPALAGAWRPQGSVLLTLAAVAVAAGPSGARPARLVPLGRGYAALLAALAVLAPWGGARVPLRPGAVALALAGGAGAAGAAGAALGAGAPAGLLAALALAAGAGYVTGVSPFVLCALVAAVAVNAAPRRSGPRRLRRLLARGERLAVAGLWLAAAALLARPTAGLLAAGVLVAGLGAAGGWAAARWGGPLLRVVPGPLAAAPAAPAATPIMAGSGNLALALAVNFALMNDVGAAVLTAAAVAVLTVWLAGPLRLRAAGVVAAARRRAAGGAAEVPARSPADWTAP